MSCQICLNDNCIYFATFSREGNCVCHLTICNECAPTITKCLTCNKKITGFMIDKDIERLNEYDQKFPYKCQNCDLVIKRRELPDHPCRKKPKIIDLTVKSKENEYRNSPILEHLNQEPNNQQPLVAVVENKINRYRSYIFTNSEYLISNLDRYFGIATLYERNIKANFACIVVSSEETFGNICNNSKLTNVIGITKYGEERQNEYFNLIINDVMLKKHGMNCHSAEISSRIFNSDDRHAINQIITNCYHWAIFIVKNGHSARDFIWVFVENAVKYLLNVGMI